MSITKQTKDYFKKIFWYGKRVPSELFDLSQYFRNNGVIKFEFKKEGEEFIAVSKNFKYGSIITSAKTKKELDEKIKDAILSAFEVPSSYRKEAGINKTKEKNHMYAFA